VSIEIRRARPDDWPAIAGLCADTGLPGGEPVDPSERVEFGERWVGPYRKLRPLWTYVAVEDGVVVGYLTGSPDTASFEAERRAAFPAWMDAREWFGPEFLQAFWAENPAHLHMNFAKGSRGKGYGRALIETFFAALRERGVRRAHVFCGEKASTFWARAGFTDAQVLEPRPGVRLHAMSREI
jgi:GNAT superfamily N-acetyltransferase